ncbi:flagellar protein [Desulfallas sp. Bu1-1]|uniref:TIGR02530 family flagellar biosynthesis protein n=1 Tax=Desulfallas sp. Bu1-1 TaxID=2787620 RepID=UPI0018A0B708|nr:TIGR02530 family flagellar biosynthesis protein [Desulfallas sp. Bu1-1]MBF7081957.1 flagellar protein [Desulfallas sp. Bu1-1]
MEIKGIRVVPEPLIQQQQIKKKPLVNPTREKFQDLLFRELESAVQVKISSHARQRLQERDIMLNERDMQNITRAINRAESKGVRESLLIYGDLAMVASIKNRTIVTAMHGDDVEDRIFTNIDGAIIIKKQ